jgi:hypothetical protein
MYYERALSAIQTYYERVLKADNLNRLLLWAGSEGRQYKVVYTYENQGDWGVRDVERMGEERNLCKVLLGKSEGKKPLGRPRRR